MRKNIFFCALLFCSLITSAQKGKLKFNSSIAAGFIAGARGPALQLQTINGVKYKSWSAGAGVGLDYYFNRSIPLFIDVRKRLFDKANTPFVYVDGGYNIRWLTAAEKHAFFTNTKGGLYYDAGIGYQLPVLKGRNLFFSLGYSSKQFTNTEQTWFYIDYIWPGPSSPSDNTHVYKYNLQRLCLKVGIGL